MFNYSRLCSFLIFVFFLLYFLLSLLSFQSFPLFELLLSLWNNVILQPKVFNTTFCPCFLCQQCLCRSLCPLCLCSQLIKGWEQLSSGVSTLSYYSSIVYLFIIIFSPSLFLSASFLCTLWCTHSVRPPCMSFPILLCYVLLSFFDLHSFFSILFSSLCVPSSPDNESLAGKSVWILISDGWQLYCIYDMMIWHLWYVIKTRVQRKTSKLTGWQQTSTLLGINNSCGQRRIKAICVMYLLCAKMSAETLDSFLFLSSCSLQFRVICPWTRIQPILLWLSWRGTRVPTVARSPSHIPLTLSDLIQ